MRVLEQMPFLELLLETHATQQKALLKTASQEQTLTLSELLLNTAKRINVLEEEEKKIIHKHRNFMKKFLKPKVARKVKRTYFTKNQATLLKILKLLSKSILEMKQSS